MSDVCGILCMTRSYIWTRCYNKSVVNIQQTDWKKCNQKFRNFVKEYRIYKAHCESAGSKRRDPPWFFMYLDEILSDDHTVEPAPVIDSHAGDYLITCCVLVLFIFWLKYFTLHKYISLRWLYCILLNLL